MVLQFLIPLAIFLGVYSCTSSTEKSSTEVSRQVKKEIQLGRVVAAKLTSKYPLVKDEEFTKYINSVGGQIAELSPRKEFFYRFGVIQSEDVNAYACPGGYIFVTTGLLKNIENEAELVAVFSHEMSHVILHYFSVMYEESWLDTLGSLLAPRGSYVSTALKKAADDIFFQLIEKGRDKKYELEADRASVLFLSNSGYNPSAASSILKKIYQNEKNQTLVQTHPSLSERMNEIQKTIQNEKIPLIGKLNRETFQIQYTAFLKRNKI